MNIRDTEKEIIEEFGLFDDWMDRYEHIIELGKSLAPMDADLKTEERLVKGCQSRVWLYPRFENGKIHFEADSDALITRGLVALMVRVLSGHTPDEIVASDLTFIDAIGLKEHLSPTRSNGLVSMIKQMKMYALALSTQA